MPRDHVPARGEDTGSESILLQDLGGPLSLDRSSVNAERLDQRLSHQPLLSDSHNYPSETRNQIPFKAWSPLMLQRWVLVLFAVVFLFLVISLEIILKVSTDQRGLSPTSEHLHYLWTYGPTVVFTIIAAFWTQVDYRLRLMQPWAGLAKQPQTAENSLLLDYISPDPVSALFTSVKKRHWPVTTVLIGSALLKVLIVISTGVFFLQHSSPLQEVPFDIIEQFQLSGFNSSAVDDMAGSLYAGVHFSEVGYPRGTNGSFAVELFNSSTAIGADNYDLTAQVLSFTTDLACEPANIIGNFTTFNCSSIGCESLWASATLQSDGCYMPSLQGLLERHSGNGQQYGGWVGTVLKGTCERNSSTAQDDNRIVVLNYIQIDSSTPARNSTALICEPSIKMQRSRVTIDQSGMLKDVTNGEQIQTPVTLTADDIADAVNNTLAQTISGNRLPALGGVGSEAPIQEFSFFFSLILSSQGSTDVKDLSNTDLLAKGARTVFQGVASQIVMRYLLIANSTSPIEDFVGTVEYDMQRLFIDLVSIRIMESALCVLAFISILLVFIAPRSCTPQDPASIARFISLISGSPVLGATLSSTGHWPIESLKKVLRGTYVASFTAFGNKHDAPPDFVIESKGLDPHYSTAAKKEYWQPFATRRFAQAALFILPLSMLVALEITLRKSLQNNGLLDVQPSIWTQLGSTYVPALVMVLTKLLFSSFDFNLRILDPYVQLKRGSAKAKPSILNKTIYTWKTDAFWTAFMTGRVAVGASALAVILASLLTIATSSLYTIQQIAHNSTIEITRLDQFYNPFAMHYPKPGYAPIYDTPPSFASSLAARLAIYEKMDSPVWTDGPKVLPKLATSENVSQDLNISSVAVTIPVQQGSLWCTLVPADQISLNYSLWDDDMTNNGVDIYWPMPNVNLSACVDLSVNATTALERIASIADGYWARYTAFNTLPPAEANCPVSAATFGTWQGRRVIELSVMTCWSSIQETQADASFSLPDWKLDSLVVDESTAKNISTAPDTFLDLENWVLSGTVDDGDIDNIFSSFIRNQTTGALDTTLLQRGNFDKLHEQIQDLYSLAFAQILNLGGRNGSITTQPGVPGTATSFSTYRLKQDVPSTRVLQALLISVVVCSIVSWLTIRLTNVVPKNPCSIAAQASLVSGSSILTRLPNGTQWMDDKEFNAQFSGNVYSMGWSGDLDGERRYTIDVSDQIWQENLRTKSKTFRW